MINVLEQRRSRNLNRSKPRGTIITDFDFALEKFRNIEIVLFGIHFVSKVSRRVRRGGEGGGGGNHRVDLILFGTKKLMIILSQNEPTKCYQILVWFRCEPFLPFFLAVSTLFY